MQTADDPLQNTKPRLHVGCVFWMGSVEPEDIVEESKPNGVDNLNRALETLLHEHA